MGMAFRQVGRGSPKLQLPGRQLCILIWKEIATGFTTASAREARRLQGISCSPPLRTSPRGTAAMLLMLCPVCFNQRCRVLYRPPRSHWACRICHSIKYERRPGSCSTTRATSIISSRARNYLQEVELEKRVHRQLMLRIQSKKDVVSCLVQIKIRLSAHPVAA